jgi:Ca-activated chloride channel homolog
MSKDIESQFLDILEINTPETDELRAQIEADPKLRKSFSDYKNVQNFEQRIAQQEFSLSHDFTEEVMARLEPQRQKIIKRLCNMISLKKQHVWQSFAVCLIAILVLKLSWKQEFLENNREPLSQREDALVSPGSEKKVEKLSPPAVVSEIRDVKKQNEDVALAARDTQEQMSFSIDPIGVNNVPETLLNTRAKVSATESFSTPENRETYKAYHENKRNRVKEQPVSTFSIDVDTGSYTNTRRYLQMGQRPPVDAVRVEEFINYFTYNYPSPTNEPFGLTYEVAPSALEPSRFLLRLGVKAQDARIKETPWNLVFLIDISGSMMDQNKLPLVKQALKIIVGQMKSNDRVSLVTYAGSAGVALEPTGIIERAKIESAIDSLGAGGGTHGSAGIQKAYDLAQSARITNGVNRVILATDGDFNVGITDLKELIKLIEQKRESGIALTTLGFGSGNYQEATMEQLANKGNGNYFYIDSFKEARKVFQQDLAGTIEVVAKDVKLQVEFNPDQVTEYRLVGYENRKLKQEDFDNDTVDAGEIGSAHTVTALYEIVLADSPLARKENEKLRYEGNRNQLPNIAPFDRNAELGFLKIRYKAPDGDTSKLLEFPLKRSEVKEEASAASSDFQFVTAVSGFAEILRKSNYAGQFTLKEVATLAQGALGEDPHGYRREFLELVRSAEVIR